MPIEFCEKVRVIMPLPEGYTKVLVESTYDIGLADGGIYWDIPTELIPARWRGIGSRFIVRAAGLRQDETVSMTPDEIRASIHYSVQGITDE